MHSRIIREARRHTSQASERHHRRIIAVWLPSPLRRAASLEVYVNPFRFPLKLAIGLFWDSFLPRSCVESGWGGCLGYLFFDEVPKNAGASLSESPKLSWPAAPNTRTRVSGFVTISILCRPGMKPRWMRHAGLARARLDEQFHTAAIVFLSALFRPSGRVSAVSRTISSGSPSDTPLDTKTVALILTSMDGGSPTFVRDAIGACH